MGGEAPSRKEGRGPRRSRSFSGVVGTFTGTSRTTLKGPGEVDAEEEEDPVEEEESDSTEASPTLVRAFQGTGGPTLAQSNQTSSNQSEPSSLAIIPQMSQIIANIKDTSSSEASRPPAFKTTSMKAPYCFEGTQPFKVTSFIKSCQLIFHNDKENIFNTERKFFMTLHLLLEGVQNALSLIFPISPIKTQHTSSIIGTYLNCKPLLHLEIQVR
ncbi:hypothetical protein O181_025338 [Austropuccinia psidii MF-1]|uniref:Uncharacterized protein n=1 Tax=Austropuccinia psidii MF-1 TaxID=1389203 RepID=A0A9Q3CMK2_9BASI|nr:hypothetical protein [Austropuccinia psidii MF-1]